MPESQPGETSSLPQDPRVLPKVPFTPRVHRRHSPLENRTLTPSFGPFGTGRKGGPRPAILVNKEGDLGENFGMGVTVSPVSDPIVPSSGEVSPVDV